jgi:hypothetical protein
MTIIIFLSFVVYSWYLKLELENLLLSRLGFQKYYYFSKF